MNSDLRDKHLLVGLFVFLCAILIVAGAFSNGWEKITDWCLDKAALILGGILTLLVQRGAGMLDRAGDPTKRSTVESTTTETVKVSTPPAATNTATGIATGGIITENVNVDATTVNIDKKAGDGK